MMTTTPQWARKPEHKKTVVATPRGWMVKETGEYLKLVKNLTERLESLRQEVTEYINEAKGDDIVDTGEDDIKSVDDQPDSSEIDTGKDDIKSVETDGGDQTETEVVDFGPTGEHQQRGTEVETLPDPETEKETPETESDSETVNKVEQEKTDDKPKAETKAKPGRKKRRGRPPKNKESQVNGTESEKS